MKHLGTAVFSIGVGLFAAFGAQLSQPMYDMKKEQGQLLTYELSDLKKKYDDALTAERTEMAKRQPMSPEPSATDYAFEAAYLRALTAHHDGYVATLKPVGDPNLEALRRGWLKARKTALAQKAKIAFLGTPGPNERLAAWFSQSGFGFGAGLFFIVMGALIARRVKKAELTKPNATNDHDLETQIDVRLLLAEVAKEVDILAQTAQNNQSPTIACADAIRQSIERLAISHFQPIVDERYRLQAEIGLAVFADAFGPFSAGERNVSRAWSALVDEHWPEAVSSLINAAAALKVAHQKLT